MSINLEESTMNMDIKELVTLGEELDISSPKDQQHLFQLHRDMMETWGVILRYLVHSTLEVEP